MNNDFRQLSRKSQEFLRNGNLVGYADVMLEMAEVLLHEGKLYDELKCLVLSFYIKLNFPGNDKSVSDVVRKIQVNVNHRKLDEIELKAFYMKIVRTDTLPVALINVEESFEMLCRKLQKIV